MIRFRRTSTPPRPLSLEEKANWILNLFLIGLLCIGARIWYLSVACHETFVEQSLRPQKRWVSIPAERGTIRDRYGVPLATNEIQYNAAILYADILKVPRVEWRMEEGEKVRIFPRKEYIETLSQFLEKEFQLDAERVEDEIHSMAAVFHQIPYVVKEELSEEEFARLSILQKDWPGLIAQRKSRRAYPQGRLACSVLGYMGAMSREEYEAILEERQVLRTYLREVDLGHPVPLPLGLTSSRDARERLKEIEERAYQVTDFVGKMGIEEAFEEELRGFRGKKGYVADAKGRFLLELPGGVDPVPGQRVVLSLSSELQSYAEKLLIQNEKVREGRSRKWDRATGAYIPIKQPRIKGGAIVAMDPHTGEILALASHPRVDPNDFIPSGSSENRKKKQKSILRWLESPAGLAAIWDGTESLMKEEYSLLHGGIYDREETLSWERYLREILPEDSPIHSALSQVKTLSGAVTLLKSWDTLQKKSSITDAYTLMDSLYSQRPHQVYLKASFQRDRAEILKDSADMAAWDNLNSVLRYIPENYEKVLLLDLCRLLVCEENFSPFLLQKVGKVHLSSYRKLSMAFQNIEKAVEEMVRELFHDLHFSQWREAYGKSYLKLKRREEEEAKTYQRPYLEYYDRMERTLFQEFWKANRWELLLTFLKGTTSNLADLTPYENDLLTWHRELESGAHGAVTWIRHYQLLSSKLNSLSHIAAQEFLKSMRSYKELTRPLLGKYRTLRRDAQGRQTEQHLALAFYPRFGLGYGRSFAFQQAAVQGSVFKILTAFEALRQAYGKYGAGLTTLPNFGFFEIFDQPRRLPGQKLWQMGYWMDGTPIKTLYKGGRLIRSMNRNNGQVNLLTAMELSSNPFFSILAHDYIENPEDLNRTAREFGYGARTGLGLAGEYRGKLPNDLPGNPSGLHAYAIGQHTLENTPLQTAVMLSAFANGGKVLEPKIVKQLEGAEPSFGFPQTGPGHSFPYQDAFAFLGFDFCPFLEAYGRNKLQLIHPQPTKVRRELHLPSTVVDILREALRKVVVHTAVSGRSQLLNVYRGKGESIKEALALQKYFIGKTGTAQVVQPCDLGAKSMRETYDHTWFGGIAYDAPIAQGSPPTGNPELVIVVYLPYGQSGSQTFPVAAQMLQKWREIKRKQGH